jgi:hypothetical protein
MMIAVVIVSVPMAVVVVVAKPVAIAIMVVVPSVIVLYPAAASLPITPIKPFAVMARADPASAFIGRPSPISFMPPVVS